MAERRLDVLAFASGFSRFAGPNTSLLDLGNCLAEKLAVRFAVVTTSERPEGLFQEAIRFPVFRILASGSNGNYRRLFRGPAEVFRIRKLLRQQSPRHMLVFSSIDTAFEVALATRKSILIGYNTLFNVTHLGWSWKRAVSDIADHVAASTVIDGGIAHTQFLKALYVAVGIPESRIRVVPHCIDVERLQQGQTKDRSAAPSDGSVAHLLYAGRLEREKGVLDLLAAAEEASKAVPIMLRIVGEGSLQSFVRDEAARLSGGSSLRIEWSPRVPFPRLVPVMQGSDVVVIPSHIETFGLVALEAMAMGKALVATPNGGISEVVRNGKDGILVNPHDRAAFATALAEVAQDGDLRRRLGTSARARVLQEFDAPTVAPAFLRALDDLS